MPPRKKAKRAHSATPQEEAAAQSSANTPGSDSAGKPEPEYDFLTDPWTDEQETALLKAIIKWKPVGEIWILLGHCYCNWADANACST
jgi:MRG-binding protein